LRACDHHRRDEEPEQNGYVWSVIGWGLSVGETLARARRDAGLSVAELGDRTGIRRSVIEAIEHDDFSACGGDYGALGAIATLARVLRADPVALVQAYDAARQPGERIAAATPSEPANSARVAEAVTPARAFPPAQEPEPVAAGQDTDTQPILMGQLPEPVTGGAPPSAWTNGEPPPITIGGLPYPVTLSRAAAPAFAVHRRFMWIVLWVALLTFTGLGGILVLMGASGQAAQHAAATEPPRVGSSGTSRPARTRQPAPSHSASSRRPTSPAPPASHRSGRALIPAGIAAFGPGGVRQGDNPQLARHALAGKAAAPWHSAWYTTAHFGNLQKGTGLLLDMGRAVTITAARIALGTRIALGHHRGANLTLRIGNSPALASLRPVAHAHHADGVVRLTTTPVSGRYVLVWFTRLPRDRAGTFQVSVYDITLRGYP
jgi:cytoskeletal protein RodZ